MKLFILLSRGGLVNSLVIHSSVHLANIFPNELYSCEWSEGVVHFNFLHVIL